MMTMAVAHKFMTLVNLHNALLNLWERNSNGMIKWYHRDGIGLNVCP